MPRSFKQLPKDSALSRQGPRVRVASSPPFIPTQLRSDGSSSSKPQLNPQNLLHCRIHPNGGKEFAPVQPMFHHCFPGCRDPASSEFSRDAGCPEQSWVQLSPCSPTCCSSCDAGCGVEPFSVLDLHAGLPCSRSQVVGDEAGSVGRHPALVCDRWKDKIHWLRVRRLPLPRAKMSSENRIPRDVVPPAPIKP